MNSITRFFDCIFLMRPVVLIPVWGFSIFGYWCRCGGSGIDTMRMLWQYSTLKSFCGMFIFSLSVGAVYVVNQVADLKVDAHNDGTPFLLRIGLGQRTALLYALFLGICAVVAPVLLWYTAVGFCSCAAILLGLIYSFRPFYFSGRPIMDFLSNALGFGIIAFGVGWYLVAENQSAENVFFTAALPYFLLMCGGSISSTLPDEKGDAAEGKRTTVVVLGKRRAHTLTIVLIASGGIFAVINKDIVAEILAAATLIVDVLYSIKPSKMLMEATYKVTGGIAMILAGIIYPLLLPVSAAVFAGTRLYFRLRFGIAYPSLTPVSHGPEK